MSNRGESLWGKEVARAQANLEAMEAIKNQPEMVKSYFDVLMQLDDVRRDLIKFGRQVWRHTIWRPL